MYLKKLNGHKNIIRLLDVLYYNETPKDLYLIFEFYPCTLDEALCEQRRVGLTVWHKLFIAYQLMMSFKYIHSAKVVHRDIKPGNIMLDDKTNVVVIDFGMCRTIADKRSQLSYDVGTRPYKAPEIHAQSPKYSQASDMWSIGLMLVQLYIRKCPIAIVQETDQQKLDSCMIGEAYLKNIIQLIGEQTEDDIRSINDDPDPDYKEMINRVIKWQRKYIDRVKKGGMLQKVLNSVCSSDVIDLITKLLILNPSKRLTAAEALDHSCFKLLEGHRNKSQEIDCRSVIYPENTDIKLNKLRYIELIKNFAQELTS